MRSKNDLRAPQPVQERTLNPDHLFEPFIETDCEGHITAWNSQAEDAFGWTRSEALDSPISQRIIPSLNRHRFEQTLREIILLREDSTQERRIEITSVHRGGKEFK